VNVLDFGAVCPQAFVILAYSVTVPLDRPVNEIVPPLVALKLATAGLEILQVTIFVTKFEMVYDDELPGQKFSLPIISDVDGLNISCEIIQLILGLGTPFIDGITDTFEGKIVPEVSCKVREFEVELTKFQPG